MANAKICDRCGKFYIPYAKTFMLLTSDDSVEEFGANAVHLFKRGEQWTSNDARCADLCPECLKQVAEFIFGPARVILKAD